MSWIVLPSMCRVISPACGGQFFCIRTSVGPRVDCVRELDPAIDDRTVLDLANAGNALLLTSDKDFGEPVFRRRLVHAGVILFRLAGLSMKRKDRIIADALAAHEHEMPGAFALITAGHIRIRPTLEIESD